MVYETKKCPKCGYLIKPWGTKSTKLHYANPFTKCPSCQSIVIDGDKTEYVMHSKVGIALRLIWDTISFGFLIGLFIAGLFMLIDENLGLGGMIAGLALGVLGMGLYFYSNFATEKALSIRRTKDINYLNQLLQAKLISQKRYDSFIQEYCKSEATNEIKRKDNLTEANKYINDMIEKSNGMIDVNDAKDFMNVLQMYALTGKSKTLEAFDLLAKKIIQRTGPVMSVSKISFFLGVLKSNGIISEEEMKNMSGQYQNIALNLMMNNNNN